MSVEQEWRRLHQLYAAMSDVELLELARGKAGLTDVAQQAVDAEMDSRGLQDKAQTEALPKVAPELSASEEDPSLVELMTFQIAMDAETALQELDDRGIPVRMEPAMRQMVEGGPRIKTNWLTIFVEKTRQSEAVQVLRERMGLFPLLAPEELDAQDDPDGEEDVLTVVGDFEEAADAELARKALTDAGIWFQVEKDDGADWTTIMARSEDLERALTAVEQAFSES